MNWKNAFVSVSAVSALLYFGCETGPTIVGAPDTESIKPTVQSEKGVRLENPYTVESMLRARDSLEAQGRIDKGELTDADFKTTHHYIRFKPESNEEYQRINRDKDLVLWDFPLDYKFEDGMTSYRDAGIPEGKPNYLYTAVKVGQKLPSENYEVLAELILEPENGEELAKRATFLNHYNVLEREALRITGNLKDSPGLKKTASWRPKGKIMVYDNVLDKNLPVVTVNVRTKNWFKWWEGYTDGNGEFRCPKDYVGDISYSLKWEYPDEKFDVCNVPGGQAFYNGPNHKTGDWNLTISSGESWVHATVFNVGSYYIGQEPYGLSDAPFRTISVKVIANIDAPDDKLADYRPVYELINFWRKDHDGRNHNSINCFNILAHEFGHAHHDEIYKGGSFYRVDSRVAESWAVAVAFYLTKGYYGKYGFDLDDWDGSSHGYISTTRDKLGEQDWERGDNSAYTPLVVDLIDSYDQSYAFSNASGRIRDIISGYSLSQMESVISKATCKTYADFVREVKALPRPSGITTVMLDDFFNQFHGIAPPNYNATTIWSYSGGNFTEMYSPNGRFKFRFQSDGNLVLRDLHESNRAVWSSETYGKGATHCRFQTPGNLVVYNGSNALWASDSKSENGVFQLRLFDDGRVTIEVAPSNGLRWSTVYTDGWF